MPIKKATNKRNGSNATKASDNFTNQSATARLTQRGSIGPKPNIGTTSAAQLTSFAGSKKVRLAEKDMVKKKAVSMDDPISVDAKGARHHAPSRSRLNTATSINCAIKKAMPDPIAIRSVTKGPNSPIIWVPTNEQPIPARKPAKTTIVNLKNNVEEKLRELRKKEKPFNSRQKNMLKETLKKEATKYLDIFKDHPYIFNLGHGVLPETNPEMVDYLVKIVKDY